MVESEAKELPETVMLGSVVFGHEQMQAAIRAINELADEVNRVLFDWAPAAEDAELVNQIKAIAEADIGAAFQIRQ
ncbi:hypothetical protein LRN48_15185, partial [Staphylococcus aureus]|nr:hypothetical protein [Staphylococcus aureus]